MVRWAVVAAVVLALSGCKTDDGACSKMSKLCSMDVQDCKSTLKGVRESLGDEAGDKLRTCFLEASSCSSAAGCTAGVAAQGLGNVAKEFLDGFGKGAGVEEKDDDEQKE